MNAWVKKGILLGFRMGAIVDMSIDAARQPFFDKSTYPGEDLHRRLRRPHRSGRIEHSRRRATSPRASPACRRCTSTWALTSTKAPWSIRTRWSAVARRLARSATSPPPSQIGGVLEPVGALPVIIEDEVLVGGNCGVYEGTVVKKRAVLGTGTILNRSTPVYDIVTGEVHAASDDEPLVIPENAVVVAGSRAISHGRGKEWNLSLYTPVIVKYRDAKTDAKVQLEDLLR